MNWSMRLVGVAKNKFFVCRLQGLSIFLLVLWELAAPDATVIRDD